MLIGVPGSGKSYYVKNTLLTRYDPDSIIMASTDSLIEEWALADGKTYDDVFQKYIKDATAEMHRLIKLAVDEGKHLIWDQTNASKKSRRGKLAQIPKSYNKIAVPFNIPCPTLLKLRLESRPGKTIPSEVMNSMIKSFEFPTIDEGFNKIEIPYDQ